MIELKFRKKVVTRMRRAFQTTMGLALLCVCMQTAFADLPSGITVSIESVQRDYRASDSLMVNVRYTNVSESTIKFLTRNTALEGEINEDFLSISFNGERLPYVGRHAKRLPPTESDYIQIAAGQTVSEAVDIGFAYPLTEKGNYQISYQLGYGAENPLFRSSNGTDLNLIEDRPIRVFKQTPNINASCNSTQRSQINQALGIAESIARSARDALNNAPVELRPIARRYTEWFGQYSPARYSTAQTAFNRIASALSNRVIGFDCTCDINNRENVFAFVFANDPYNMNVCPVFFRVGPSGTDSRSGTIVHEISHFNVVIGSDDFSSALNQSGSRQLADSNPSAAIRNANAFEYFAENSPFLAMPTVDDLPDPADLLVSTVSVTDQNPTIEDLIGISAVVVNAGESESPATQLSVKLSTDPQISTGDFEIQQASLASLQPGSSFNFQSDVQLSENAGEFWIGICVAPVNGESNLSNNCSVGVPLLVADKQVIIPPILLLLLDEEGNH